MRLYLNAGFGQQLAPDVLQGIKVHGYAGVRQDIPSAEAATGLVQNILQAGLQPILLIAGGKMGTPGQPTPPDAIAQLAADVARVALELGLADGDPAAAIEIGNEPDIAYGYSSQPALFAQAVQCAREAVRAVSQKLQIVTGGISTTSKKALAYLASAADAGLPSDCIVGYHTYRTTQPPNVPLKGFPDRAAEFAALRRIAGARPIWCTETGWHTAPSIVRWGPFGIFKRRVQFDDQQVAEFAVQEVQINAAQGALGFVWFQLNDGPNPDDAEDRFGIRRMDGQWKPVAARFEQMGPIVA